MGIRELTYPWSGVDNALSLPFTRTSRQRQIQEQYRVRWSRYIGAHYDYAAEPGEVQPRVNLIRALVDKHVDYLFGSGFKFTGNRNLWPFVERIINYLWSGMDRTLFGFELGQMGSVTGDAYVKVWLDTDAASSTYGLPRFSVIPCSSVIPDWEPARFGVDRRMRECRVVRIEDATGEPPAPGGEPDKIYFTEVFNRQEILHYRNNTLIAREPNPIGEIPIVHIQNLPLSGSWEGKSDVEEILALQDEINSKTTALGRILDYHQSPTVVAYGIRPGQLRREPGNIWYAPSQNQGGRVDVLQLLSDLRPGNEYVSSLKALMHDITGVPESALGRVTPVSHTSGVALHMQYKPLLQRVERSRATYGSGIVEATRLALKLVQLFSPNMLYSQITPSVYDASPQIRMAYPVDTIIPAAEAFISLDSWRACEVQVKWPDMLPKDVMMELEKIRFLQSLGTIPDRIIIRKLMDADLLRGDEDPYFLIQEAQMDSYRRMATEYGMAGMGIGEEQGMVTGETVDIEGSRMQHSSETVGSGEDYS